MDIFNFSRKPGGKYPNLQNEFRNANRLRTFLTPLLSSGNFVSLKTGNPEIFAYSISYNNSAVVVFGNMNFRSFNEANVIIPKYNSDILTIPLKITVPPISEKGKIKVKLAPGEVQVLMMNEFEIK